MVDSTTFKHILHIGPNYIRHKGGMGAVIATYERYMTGFNFIASYEGNFGTVMNLPFFALSYIKILWQLLFNKRIRIVHMHGASYGSFYRKYLVFLTAKFFFGKAVIYHLHAAEFHTFYQESNPITRRMIAHLMNKTNCVIVLSKSWELFVKSNFKPKMISIINNPIEIPKAEHTRALNDTCTTSFLFLGRIGNRKGLFDLLDVVADNYMQLRNRATFVIGGDGEVDKLNAYINKYGLEDIVKYAGWVDGKTKHKLISECHALILPSYNEGLPIAILEAMSYGKAIISTNVGGIPEVVKENLNGYLIAPGDKSELRNKIFELLESKEKVINMGNKSRIFVNDFRIEEVVKNVRNVYDKVLSQVYPNNSN